MITIDFDVNQIIKVSYRQSYHDTNYVWKSKTATPNYKKFLWFKKLDGYTETEEGFYAVCFYYGCFSVLEMQKRGYIINYDLKTFEKQVWVKAYVEVSLTDKSIISRRFDTNEEAIEWITSIKAKSKKTFETVKN